MAAPSNFKGCFWVSAVIFAGVFILTCVLVWKTLLLDVPIRYR